jgi:hypothetical protein
MTGMDAESEAVDSFYQEPDEKHLIPLWKVTAKLLPPEPQQAVGPLPRGSLQGQRRPPADHGKVRELGVRKDNDGEILAMQ